MAVIALFAASMAALRIAVSQGGVVLELAAGVGLIGVAILVGIERWVVGPRGFRPFWGGFVAGGVLGPISILLVASDRVGSIADLWEAYADGLEVLMNRWPELGANIRGQRSLHALVIALYYAFPQIGLAIAIGIIVQLTAWKQSTRRDISHARSS